MGKLTEHQQTQYAKLLAQLDAVATLAEHGFPRNDHMRVSTAGAAPSGAFDAHYAFIRFLHDAGRSALEEHNGK